MSGAELCLGVLGTSSTSQSHTTADNGVGAAIPVMQAAIAAIGRLESPTGPRLHARSIAELHSEASQEWFSAIYSNLQLYQEVVEPNVEEQDRAFASNVRTNVYRMVTKSQETIDQLLAASRDQRSRPEDLRALEDKLGEYAKYLNNFQVSLMKYVTVHSTFAKFSSLRHAQSFTSPAIPTTKSGRSHRLHTISDRRFRDL